MILRREQPSDHAGVRSVHRAAFAADGEPSEVRLVDELRRSVAWVPALSWVAEEDGKVVGHVVCSRGALGGARVVGLGPLGVHPSAQGRGIGSALMYSVIGAADALGEALIALLGAPDYYGRFGFVPASRRSIEAPDPQWGDHFQVRTLSEFDPATTGAFVYAPPFSDLT